MEKQFWEKTKDYPKESFCHLQGTSPELDKNLFHAKIMVINNEKEDNQITDDSLLYFGSHNFSPSAWGRIEKNGD